MDQKPRILKGNSSVGKFARVSSNLSNPCSSTSSSETSYAAKWEEYIRGDGTVFYVEFGTTKSSSVEDQQHLWKQKSLTTRSGKQNSNLISKLGRTRDDYHSRYNISKARMKEIRSQIYAGYHTSYPQLSTEAALGIYTLSNSNNQHLIVSGFTEKYKKSDCKQVSVGDILMSINNINVSKQNIEDILSQFSKPVDVVLKFKSYDNLKMPKQTLQERSQQITSFEAFSQMFARLLNRGPFQLVPVALIVMDTSDIDTGTNQTIFCYPSKESNLLLSIRGSLLTLISIASTELSSHPLFSSVVVDGKVYSVFYIAHDTVLILCCFFDDYVAPLEGHVLVKELVKYLRFYHSRISIPLQETIKIELEQICHVLERRITKFPRDAQIETLFHESKMLPMPSEARIRIFDAISEMNAMDYRDWNEQPLTSHRHFFIHGCSLYYESFLLASHLPPAQLGNIELFLRLRGIFDLIEERNVCDLVLWEEIPVTVSDSKFFLAITGRNKLLLVVILQLFETKSTTSDYLGYRKTEEASLFYVEEMQGTLDHLHQGGIDVLAGNLVKLNAKPNTVKCRRGSTRMVNFTEYFSVRKNCIFGPEKTISLIPGTSLHSSTHSEESNQKGIEDDSDSDWDNHQGHQKFLPRSDMSEIKGSCLKDVNMEQCRVATRITKVENVLIHYIYQDIDNNIIISPCQLTSRSTLSVFRRTCQYICELLQSIPCKRLSEYHACEPNRKTYTVMKEYGVLTLTKNIPENLYLWTIGIILLRLKRRLYICSGSNIFQSAIEVALRLSFNC